MDTRLRLNKRFSATETLDSRGDQYVGRSLTVDHKGSAGGPRAIMTDIFKYQYKFIVCSSDVCSVGNHSYMHSIPTPTYNVNMN